MGVEPTLGRANDRADGFEDREAHRDPYTSVCARRAGVMRPGARGHAYCAMPTPRSSTLTHAPKSRGLSSSYEYARLAAETVPLRRDMDAGAEAPGRVGGGRQPHGRPERPAALLEMRRAHATGAKHLPELRGVATLRSAG